jgi:hypothetical protein
MRRAERRSVPPSRLGALESLERRVMLDSTVVFNEVMYHPAGSGTAATALEWVELYNPMAVDVDLSGWRLDDGIDFRFPEGTIIKGGGYLVISADPAALQAASGYAGAVGPFTGRLSDSGEELELKERNGRVMDSVDYATRGSWPVAPDGSGVSLAKVDPNTASDRGANWAASASVNGTPGAVNSPSGVPAPVLTLNEISAGTGGFVELANPTASSQSVGGYVIRRTSATADNQYVLPAGSIASRGYLSIAAAQLGFTPVNGDKLFLVRPDGSGVADATVVDNKVRGRSPDGTGRWLNVSQATPGGTNTFSFRDEVVINEIMYHHQPQQGRPGSVQTSTLLNVTDAGWKYEQSGTDLGTGWRAADFPDGGWSPGQGVFWGGNVPGVIGTPARVAIPTLFGTGLNALGQLGTSGAPDTHFTVTPPGSTSRQAVIMTPHAAYAPNSAGSGWISPVADGNASQAVGDYRYKTTFSLDGFVPTSAQLTLTLWADNFVRDVLINGKSTGIRIADPGFATASGPFTITTGFVGGVNTLEFVSNNSADFPNPHGFRAAISGTALPIPKNTQLNLGPKTYYFRKGFNFSGDPAITQLTLDPIVDDGAVFFLNGVEIYRKNMPDGAIDYNTPASPAVGTPTFGAPVTLTLPAGLLKQGSNVLAVEVHQAAGDTSDVAMGLTLGAIQTIPALTFTESKEEWVELYNRSAGPVDLGGWRLNDAIGYTFPAGTTLGAGEYLVVAKDAATVAARYPSARVLGNYSGSLSRSGESLELLDPSGNPADEVRYYDGKPWPDAADGGGSSLELRDPNADNSKAEAWAASDEGTKSGWKTYTYSGTAVNLNGDPTQWNEFIIGLLDSGEVLLDDISVIDLTVGANAQVLQNGTFEGGGTAWRLLGNHGRGGVVTDPTNPNNKVLRLVASGPTEHMHNHLETTLVNNQPIVDGHTYQISFRAKWISGSPLLNTRLYFNRLAKTTVLDVPQANGTPGARNSTYVANAGPTFSDLRQSVVLPAANAGTIPGQPAAATVLFYVRATDAQGAAAMYPAAGPNARALYKVNDGVGQSALAHTVRIIMTAADINFMYANTNLMSNEMLGATVVYDNREVFYDVDVSLYSSQRGRVSDARVGFKIDFNADRLFRGTQARMTVDRSGSARPQDEILMKQVIAHAGGGVPSNYNDIAKVIAPRSQNTGSTLLQFDPYGQDYLDAGFPSGSDGNVYKLELIYYPTQTTDGNPESLKVPQPDQVVGVDIGDLGNDPELYRHHYQLTNNHDRDDFTPVMNLAKAFGLSGSALEAAARQQMDVDEWMRLFAILSLSGATDTYGAGLPHNFKMYSRASDGKMMALQWDWDQTFGQSTTAPLIVGGNVAKIINLPTNKHLYYGHLHDVITTTYNSSYMSRWASHYGSLAGQDYSGDLNYIAQRSAYVLGVLPPQVAFSITTPSGQTVNTPTITLTGKGWVNVKQIVVRGSAAPLDVAWSGTNVDTWAAAVPLQTGANSLTLDAYDFQGKLIASQTFAATSTANTPNLPANLRVTELNFSPAPPPAGSPYETQDFEFIEFKNFGTQPLNLAGAHFTNGIEFTFGDVTLAPGQVGVVARSAAAFQSRYGTGALILGTYGETTTNFGNGGEPVTLVDSADRIVVDFTYAADAASGWYPGTDGGGPTLEVIQPSANVDLSNPVNWRPSPVAGGTPGVDDTIPPTAPTGLAATGGDRRVTLAWAAVAGAASYNVYRGTAAGGQDPTPLAIGIAGTSFVDTTAAPGATYYYVVSAVNPGGEGPRSAEGSAYSHLGGDANDDGRVNFADLLALAKSYGQSGKTWAQGDFTGDGVVNFADLLLLAKNYNVALPGLAVAGDGSSAAAMPSLATALAQVNSPAPVPPAPTTPAQAPAAAPASNKGAGTPVKAQPPAKPVPPVAPKPVPKPVVTKPLPPKPAPAKPVPVKPAQRAASPSAAPTPPAFSVKKIAGGKTTSELLA